MLTEEGYRNRFWRGYPHLRRLLERSGESVPQGVDLFSFFDDGGPCTSIDNGLLGRLADVLAIARLVASQGRDVQDAIHNDTPSSARITDEVKQLLGELEARIYAFKQAVDQAFTREIEATR